MYCNIQHYWTKSNKLHLNDELLIIIIVFVVVLIFGFVIARERGIYIYITYS